MTPLNEIFEVVLRNYKNPTLKHSTGKPILPNFENLLTISCPRLMANLVVSVTFQYATVRFT